MIAASQIFLGRGGAKLPYDAEVEYLESKGTQWIGTGFIPDQDSQLELTFENTNTDTTVHNLWLAGAFIGSGNTNLFGVRITFGDSEVACYASSPARAFYYGPNIGVKLTAAFKDKTWSIANVTSGVAGDFECRAPLTLFAINWATTTSSYTVGGYSIARIYRFRAWDNGILVRDVIPVRFTNELGQSEGAMYDRVSGQILRNQGTGSFVVGPDIVPVEYIESHGTEWIDTGFKANTGTTSFEISLTPKNLSQYPQGLFGSRNTLSAANSSFNAFMMTGGAVRADFVGSDRGLNSGMTANSLFVIRYDNRRVYVNGVPDIMSYAENSTLQDYNFLVGSFTNGDGTPYSGGFIGLIRYVKLWSSGVLVRDLIPVRVGSGSTWEGAMMDTLTRRIYRNAGTGAFGYGNDK